VSISSTPVSPNGTAVTGQAENGHNGHAASPSGSTPDSQAHSPRLKGLKCRECGAAYELAPKHVCEMCFGPLEVDYNYEVIGQRISRESIQKGPYSIWRYADLLPADDASHRVDLEVGFTPLMKADRLAKELGLKNLYIKNDSTNPTWSFKDRVVSVALTRAREFGFTTAACASTGNLANSVAAHAARAGMKCFVFIPSDLEAGKVMTSLVYAPNVVSVRGNYDEVNRLCSEIADRNASWAFVNINVRPYYSEGSKTLAYEVAEQLGWKAPDHVVIPIASGSMLTKIHKGFSEFMKLGLIEEKNVRISGAQATGCNPVAHAFENWARFRLAGQAEDDCQKPGNRQSGGRHLRAGRDRQKRRRVRAGQRRGDRRGHQALGADRGNLYRDGGRRFHRRPEEAGRSREDRSRRDDGCVHHGHRAEDAGSHRGPRRRAD
jgi:cysteine synthase